MVALGLGISAFIAVVAFVGISVATVATALRYKKSKWLAVGASVKKSYVSKTPAGRGTTMYTPTIEYHYEYQGVQYQSTTISPDLHYAGSSEPSFAEKWVALLPEGTQVTAYVDQNKPARAVLFPEYRYGWWYAIGASLAVFGFCNLLLLAAFGGVYLLNAS